ncbi:MAG TPA: hypothetical protein VES20_13170, partial [Bryobacteraceae bacterium]|nr:hypothetical protein [Bryobacteraceae bacterium]
MNRKHLVRHAAILALTAAAILPLSAQTTSQIVANPSGVTINLAAPIGQQVALSLAGGATGVITVTPAQGLLVNNSRNSVAVQAPGTITINVDPNNRPTGLSQLYVDANVFGSTLPGYRIPVSFGTGGGGGNPIGNFFATPNSLSFSAPTGTQTASQSFNVSSTTGAIPTYYISTSNAAWLQTSPSPGVQTTSSVVTVLANPVGLAPGTYSGSISLIPTASGFTTITVPVNLTVGQAGSGSFYATPTAVNFTYATGSTSPITQSFTLSSTMGQVPYTAVLSTNLVNYGLQLTPTSGTAPQTVSITLPSPQLVPAGTSGFITITPAAGSGASAFTIPVNINGTGTGTGSLTISPSTLTFSSPIGGGVPPVQVISVNSATGTPQSFTVSASSSQNFITAQASSNVTPATVTVGVSPFAATTPGTYIGTVNITPTTGPSAGVAVPIQVTYTIGTVSGGQVTPDESAVTLETQAGATTRVTRAVALRATGTAVSYTTAVTTTGGGNWLSVDPATGTAPSTIVIAADPSNLAPGTYTGAIAFTPAGQSAFSIGVTLNVASSGELRAAPASLSFAHQTTTTTGPASQTVQLTSTGTALTWTATPTTTAGGNWLQVTPATGATGTAATISVNITGLAAGSYTGNVRFTSPGA